MAFLGTLLSISEPSGAWIGVIKAFEAVTNNYVLAIIFLTVVIRLIWSVVDTFNRYNQQKMNAVQLQMQPEIEKVKIKYANQPQILNQKQNEIYRKYYGRSYYVGCLVMLVIMILNLVIFFTLFSGLNTMGAYKIASNYDNLKYGYANCINVTDQYLSDYSDSEKLDKFIQYDSLGFIVSGEGEEKTISLVEYQKIDGEFVTDESGARVYTVLQSTAYKDDFSSTVPGEPDENNNPTEIVITSNANILSLIHKIFPVYEEGDEPGSKEIVISSTPAIGEDGQPIIGEDGQPVMNDLYLSTAVQNVAMEYVVAEYDATQDSFLWIENIWIADSPTSKSIISYSTLESQMGKDNVVEGEEEIYNAFMPELKDARSRANGYYILPLLCVAVSVLSIFISNNHTKRKNRKAGIEVQMKGGNKWVQIIVPVMLGIFALFYNSVFAIYMLTGQVVSTILLPLQLFIIDKLTERKAKKDESKNQVTIDYSRKF